MSQDAPFDTESDILDIQRNFIIECREPATGERVHVEDPEDEYILRQYIYIINEDGNKSWVFEKLVKDEQTRDNIDDSNDTNSLPAEVLPDNADLENIVLQSKAAANESSPSKPKTSTKTTKTTSSSNDTKLTTATPAKAKTKTKTKAKTTSTTVTTKHSSDDDVVKQATSNQDAMSVESSKQETVEPDQAKPKRSYNRKNVQKSMTLMVHLQEILVQLQSKKYEEATNRLQECLANKTLGDVSTTKITQKKTRAKTEYNKFISERLHNLKDEQPELSTADRMRRAVSDWHAHKITVSQ
jgi:hypothetical protein